MPRTANAAEAKRDSDFADLSIATMGGLALALIAIFLCVVPLSANATSTRDYVVFWATGQQLIHHSNPYDPAAMDKLERAAGLAPEYGILYMRNPPWALPLALPLGLMSEQIGGLYWSLLLLACLVLAGLSARALHGNPPNRIHWIAFSFAPSLICLFMGQTALFSLLGLALFLRCYRTHPFGAGCALWLCSIKPHLFLPFGVALIAWVLLTRSYKIVAGAAAAFAASCALTWLIAPSAWSGYAAMMRAPSVEKEFIPCLSVVMRLWISPQSTWLQYLLPALSCGWAFVYFWRRRFTWDWAKDSGMLILMGLIAAPYCWPYDQTIASPALLHGAYTTRSRVMLALLALSGVPVLGAIMIGIKITTPYYLFIAPAWLAWLLVVHALAKESGEVLTERSAVPLSGGSNQ